MSPPYRLVKMMVFQTMEGIVMHKGAHRPVIRYDFARKPDQPSQLHPLVFAIGDCGYLIHEVVISKVLR